MLPTGKEITARTAILVEEISKWARDEFELPDFSVTYALKAKTDRMWCRGGIKPYMQLGVKSLLSREVVAFIEYKSFNNYLEVGGFKTDDWRLFLDACIVHEMSHAIQFELRKKWSKIARDNPGTIPCRTQRGDVMYLVPGLGWSESNHGSFFLHIYKRARNRFVNDRVPREAYTAPRKCFADPLGDALDKAFGVAGKPLEGCLVRINRGWYVIQGFNADTRRDYAWSAKCPQTGRIVNLKLVDIAHTPEARKIIFENSALKAMYDIAQERVASRRQASATRRMRRSFTIGY